MTSTQKILFGLLSMVLVIILLVISLEETGGDINTEGHRGDDSNDIGVIKVSIDPLVKEKENPRNINVTVQNFGENKTNSDGRPGFRVEVSIKNDESVEVYNESQSVDEVLEMGDNHTVSFNDGNGMEWVPEENGEYRIFARGIWEQDEENIDENGNNDLMIIDCLVEKEIFDISILDLNADPMIQDVAGIRVITAEVKNDGNTPLENKVEITFEAIFDGSTINDYTIVISLQPDESTQVTWDWQSFKYGEYTIEVEGIILGESETNLDNNTFTLEDIITVETIFSDTREEGDSPYYLDRSSGEFKLWDYVEMGGLFWTGDNETDPGKAGWHVDSTGHFSIRSWYGGIPDTQRYGNNMRAQITSHALNLEDFENVYLTFYTKYVLEGAPYDFVEISVSNDEESWEQLVRFPDTGEDKDSAKEPGNEYGWLHKGIEIPVIYLKDTFYMRIMLKTDNAITFRGVFIDDIILYGTASGNHPPVARFSATHDYESYSYSQNVIKNPPVELIHIMNDDSLNNLPRPIGEHQGGLPLNTEIEFSALYLTFDPDADDDSDNLAFRWDFGDGNAEFGMTAQHIYQDLPMEGYFIVTLRVTDDHDFYSEDTIKVWFGNKAPDADYIVTPYFDTSTAINDMNDGIENGIIDVFYGDRLVFLQRATDPENDPLSYHWTFHCVDTMFETEHSGDTISGTVGEDFLYEGLDGNDPIIPLTAMDYTVTILVNDGNHYSEKSYTLRVHLYATAAFTKHVQMGVTILDAIVTLTWRGFPEEAAPSSDLVSPERPVFVYIDENATSPDLALEDRGGIGLVYDIHAVGCLLQNGEEGFIEAEVRLPILSSDLEEIGDSLVLQEDLRLEYYDEVEKRFMVVQGSYVIADEGWGFVVGDVDHFSILTAIVDSIYNPSNPGHQDVLPDLMVINIEFSRSPALNGQEVEVRAFVKNTGIIHARNVDVNFYDGGDLIGEERIDVVRGSGDEVVVMEILNAFIINPDIPLEEHNIGVIVNKIRSIEEAPENYGNNEEWGYLHVVRAVNIHPWINITDPEDDTTVTGTITIDGTSSIEIMNTTVTITEQPFGNNDCAYPIVSVEPAPPSVLVMSYSLLDDTGTIIAGVHGLVADIYGLNFDDEYTNISFQDNDRDGKVSAGDVFLLKNKINGGQWIEGYSLLLKNISDENVEKVEISINNGSWMVVSGTDDWTYEWDTITVENGNSSLRFRAYCRKVYSEIAFLYLDVRNPEDNVMPDITITEPADGSTLSGKISIKGIASDEDGIVEMVELAISGGSWLPANGTETWEFEWDTKSLDNGEYIIKARSYDGNNYSEEISITVMVANKDEGGDGGDSDDNFLFEQIGPLPLIGYLGIIAVIVIVGLVVGTKRNGKTKENVTPTTTPSPQPPPAQSSSSAQLSYQHPPGPSSPPVQSPDPSTPPVQPPYQQQSHQPQYPTTTPPTQPPRQPPTQHVQPQATQQYSPQAPTPPTPAPSPPLGIPLQSDGSWICPTCGKKAESNFVFCMGCGYKRGS